MLLCGGITACKGKHINGDADTDPNHVHYSDTGVGGGNPVERKADTTAKHDTTSRHGRDTSR